MSPVTHPWMTALLATGQIAVSNILEVQNGNTPFVTPEDRVDVYDQLNVDYATGDVRLGVRFETNRNSEDALTYDALTQRYAEWSDAHVRVRVGNVYAILGRGLVHRSFELTGVVRDQPGFRARYGFSRDVDGVLVEGARGILRATAIAGTPNGGEFSPGTEEAFGLERYRGQLAGGQIRLDPVSEVGVGAAYARFSPNGDVQRHTSSVFVEADPVGTWSDHELLVPVYVEYAADDVTFGEFFDLDTGPDRPHALYASANVLWRRLALSAEWKDYVNFQKGTNDPPSLVREHAFALLNRNTHVLEASDETGFQLEGTATWPGKGTLVANLSRSDGAQAGRPVRFEERYLEIAATPARLPALEATVFLADGKDEFVAVAERHVVGVGGSVRVTPRWSVAADVERQRATRRFVSGLTERWTDLYASLSVSVANVGSASVVWEHTNDPVEEDPADFASPGVEARDFIGVALSGSLSARHEVRVFAGERRGGIACTAGTCYEVPAFTGIEARLTSRF